MLLDIGTTAYRLARQLHGRRLTVITSNLVVYEELADDTGIELVLLGGMVRREYRSLVGFLTEDNLRQLHADWLFLGTSGSPPGRPGHGHHGGRGAGQAGHDRGRRHRWCCSPTRASSPAPGMARVCGPGRPRRRGDQRPGGPGDQRGVRARPEWRWSRYEADDPRRRRIPGAAGVRGTARRSRRGPGHRGHPARPGRRPARRDRAGARPSRRAGVPDAPAVDRHHRPRRGAARRRLRLLRDPRRRPGGPGGRRAHRARRGRARPGDGRRRRHRLRAAHRPGRRGHRPAGRPARPRRLGHQLHQPGRPGHRGHVPRTSATGSSASATPRSAWAAASPARWAPTRTRRLDRLRRAQPPRLAARPARRRPRRAARGCSPIPTLLGSFEEGRLFGADWLRTLGAIPNEYLHYYYFNREAVRAVPGGRSRPAAPSCATSRRGFYDAMQRPGRARRSPPGTAPAPSARPPTWPRTARRPASASATTSDLESGGYEKVALALMRAIARDERTTPDPQRPQPRHPRRARRGRRHRGAVPGRRQRRPPGLRAPRCPTTPPAGDAPSRPWSARSWPRPSGSRAAAVRAFALHPLVDSVTVAGRLVDGCTHRASRPRTPSLSPRT